MGFLGGGIDPFHYKTEDKRIATEYVQNLIRFINALKDLHSANYFMQKLKGEFGFFFSYLHLNERAGKWGDTI